MIGTASALFRYAWRFAVGGSFRRELEEVLSAKRVCLDCPSGYDPPEWCDEHEAAFRDVMEKHDIHTDG